MSTVKKVRKRRKPMTAEQRKAAAERLAKARKKKKPAELKSIHENVRNLDEEDFLCYENVKRWIDTQTKIQSMLKKKVRDGERHANSKLNTCNTYLVQLKSYLRDGIWTSLFVGEYMDILIREPQTNQHDYEEYRYLHRNRYRIGYRLIEEPNSICFEGRENG